MELTKSEMEIMDEFWEKDVPLSRSDLLGKQNKCWKDSSVHILLNGLLKKEMLQEVGVVRRSKTYGRTFRPTMTREEYYAAVIFSHRNKPEPEKLFAALLERPEITQEALQYLCTLLDQKV
jgi:predicted transcriptional regulator